MMLRRMYHHTAVDPRPSVWSASCEDRSTLVQIVDLGSLHDERMG